MFPLKSIQEFNWRKKIWNNQESWATAAKDPYVGSSVANIFLKPAFSIVSSLIYPNFLGFFALPMAVLTIWTKMKRKKNRWNNTDILKISSFSTIQSYCSFNSFGAFFGIYSLRARRVSPIKQHRGHRGPPYAI
jgi:hypothetical protein